MVSSVKTLATSIVALGRSYLPQSKEASLEKVVSLHVLQPDFQKKTTTKELSEYLITSNASLKKAQLSFVYKTCLKTARFILKILDRKNTFFDKLLKLNELADSLRKKNLEILSYKTKTADFLDLSAYQKSPFLSQTLKIGLLELEKFQLNLYVSDLEKAKEQLRQTKLSKEQQHQIFHDLPLLLQQKILAFASSLEIDNMKAMDNLQEIFSIKQGNSLSFFENLTASFNHHILHLNELINEKKQQFLVGDPMFDKFGGVTTESFVFDCSTDNLAHQMSSEILQQPLHVAMVAVEYSGLVKEGGLAEAVEGLSKSLKEHHKSNKVTLVYPKFSNLPASVFAKLGEPVVYKSLQTEYKVYTLELDGVEIKLIDHPAFQLPKGCRSIYGPDDAKQQERFAIFNALATDYLLETVQPQLIHLHDWHAAGILAKIKKDHKQEWENGDIPPVVFTFHNNNRASQGRTTSSPYSYEKVVKGYVKSGILGQNENLFVKTLEDADMITTVSETFGLEAHQLKYGEGISFAVRAAAKQGKLFGIINGSNPHRWNPETDPLLKNWKDLQTGQPLDLSYSPETTNLVAKKAEIKNQLKLWVDNYLVGQEKRQVTFDFSKPFVTYVGRFDSYQKGLDKLEEAIVSTIKNGGQFICMGMGEDSEAKKILDELEKKYKKGVLFIRDFKDAEGKIYYQQGNSTRPGVGSLIRACSEFIFIPSRFEPCGLVQFEGWLFGSLAIGSKTGGLVDTIKPRKAHPDDFNGFLFCREAENEKSCKETIEEALTLWSNCSEGEKNKLIKRIITEGRQYGWDSSPAGYSPLEKYRFVYEAAIKASKNRQQFVKKLPSVDAVKLMPFHNVEHLTKAEETYLYHYYNPDKLQVSAETLKALFNQIPISAHTQLPSPFGKDIQFKKYQWFGGHLDPKTGISRFLVSAPQAKSVVLQLFDENEKLTAEYTMKKNASGDWTLPRVEQTFAGQRYVYKIDGRVKCDPFGKGMLPSKHSTTKCYSILTEQKHAWNDQNWMRQRSKYSEAKKPLNIFEIHLTTWKKKPDGSYLNYREMGVELVKHAKAYGFSHIELMGILEHPHEGSWGYQPSGYFAPNHRMGSIDDFKFMIDYLHQHNIGAILDFIPGHFAIDDYGLKLFDGTRLYEPTKFSQLFSLRYWFYHYGANHFDFSKKDIKNFLISSAHFWLKEMHLDGLRVDCVSGILRSENPEASKNFIRDLNAVIHQETPGAVSIAEDFSGNPLVLGDPSNEGLGFDYRWNTAWNHFALKYFHQKTLHPTASNYKAIQSALLQKEQESQIAYFSHDETNKQRGVFLDILKSLSPAKRLLRVKSFLSFLLTSSRNHLLFSGLEQLNVNHWDLWIGKKESFSSIEQPSAEEEEIQNMLKDIEEVKKTQKALVFDTQYTQELIEDPSHTIHAYRKTYEDNSVVILHNLTEKEDSLLTIKVRKKEDVAIQPQEIFFSNGNFGNNAHILEVKDQKDYVVYTVSVPAETTLMIKEC